jgi:hypothetical protein
MLRRLSPQVLAQRVQDGGDEDRMSVELLQEQVELYLEYAAGSLSKWQNFLGDRLCDFFKWTNPASVHAALSWQPLNLFQFPDTVLARARNGMVQQTQFTTQQAS